MSTTESFPFNSLPLELQREIFVVAANKDPRNALKLVLVARRVHSWVQPCIYDLVTLGNDDTALFMRAMDSIPPEFFSTNVKRLCLSVSVGGRNATRILAACSGIVDLAFWVDYLRAFPNNSLTPYISPLPLRRLSIEFSHYLHLFRDPQMRPGWCETLTHLDIIFWQEEKSPVLPHLEELSSLTHLLLRLRHNQIRDNSLLAILSACQYLKLLIIYDDTDTTEDTISSVDSRVVHMRYPPHIVREWEAQAVQDPGCVWARAEELIRRHTAERQRWSLVTSSMMVNQY
ncbi:hypothetical protein B0H34DRAFT_660129 [Crassisporium funariophilum]|nr:hypothetical protein B0H34DRAFT_660129 [Crassisporium funariophilum]